MLYWDTRREYGLEIRNKILWGLILLILLGKKFTYSFSTHAEFLTYVQRRFCKFQLRIIALIFKEEDKMKSLKLCIKYYTIYKGEMQDDRSDSFNFQDGPRKILRLSPRKGDGKFLFDDHRASSSSVAPLWNTNTKLRPLATSKTFCIERSLHVREKLTFYIYKKVDKLCRPRNREGSFDIKR